jgi:hypothetical protein
MKFFLNLHNLMFPNNNDYEKQISIILVHIYSNCDVMSILSLKLTMHA